MVKLKLSAFARLFGATVEHTERVFTELVESGVADVNQSGDEIHVTCRRIVRDFQDQRANRQALSEAGRRGVEVREAKRKNKATPHARHDARLKPPMMPGLSIPEAEAEAEDLSLNTREKSFPTLEQVRTVCPSMGVPVEAGEAIWNHFESCAWVDRNGNQITNWRAKIKSCWLNEESKRRERDHHKNGLNLGDKAQTVRKEKNYADWQQK